VTNPLAELMMARSGQALVEYILLIALVAVALLASLLLFRGVLAERLLEVSETVESHMPGAQPGDPGGGTGPPGNGGNLPPGQGGTPPGKGGTPPGKAK
jgi:Flp pilus assembly pilin Flp